VGGWIQVIDILKGISRGGKNKEGSRKFPHMRGCGRPLKADAEGKPLYDVEKR